MEFWRKLQSIDRRVIYLLLFIVLLIPLINPLGLPLEILPWTRQFYDYVEENIQPGDLVVLSLDYSVGGAPDIHPQAVAVSKHLAQRNARMAFIAFFPDGPQFAEKIISELETNYGKVYGQDVINLGYLAGGEGAIAAFCGDVKATVPKDYRGKPLSEYPNFSDLNTIKDAKAMFEFASGTPGVPEWVRQEQTVYGVPLLAGCVAVIAPQTEPYLQSGQLQGILVGLRGAAEYEVVSRNPGKAAAAMDSQSMGHLLIIAFVLLGNIGYFALGEHKKRKAK